jgi:hypothetical protein
VLDPITTPAVDSCSSPPTSGGDRTNSFTSKHIAEPRITVLQQLAVFDPAVFIAEFIALSWWVESGTTQ